MLEKDIDELRQGNDSALANIYKETRKSVFSICFTLMHDYSLAEDMMQDTYIKIKDNINQYKSNTNPKAWINVIARNICLNELKKRKKELITDFFQREDIRVYDDIKIHDESGIIATVVRVLNENESKIVLMHTLGDISLKEIAGLLKKPEGTIRWQYNNSLKKLRKKIDKEDLKNE